MSRPPVRLHVPKPRHCQSLIVWEHDEFVELGLLVVEQPYRRRGIGSDALARVKHMAEALGKPVRLMVDRPRRVGLTQFYAKNGFTVVDGLQMEWRPDECADNQQYIAA